MIQSTLVQFWIVSYEGENTHRVSDHLLSNLPSDGIADKQSEGAILPPDGDIGVGDARSHDRWFLTLGTYILYDFTI